MRRGFWRCAWKVDLSALAVELRDAKLLAEQAKFAGGEQVEDGFGRIAVAVFELGADIGQRGLVFGSGDALVHAQPLVLLGNVAGVDTHRNAEVDRGSSMGWFLLLALDLAHSLFEHCGIEIESDGLDVAGLFAAEHISRTA